MREQWHKMTFVFSDEIAKRLHDLAKQQYCSEQDIIEAALLAYQPEPVYMAEGERRAVTPYFMASQKLQSLNIMAEQEALHKKAA